MLRKKFYLTCVTSLRTLPVLAAWVTTLCLLAAPARAQEHGFHPGGSYALSDIEAINASNGNMIVTIPLASLPLGRGGVPGPKLSLVYNSKLYATHTEELTDQTGKTFNQIFLNPDQNGGWRYSTNYGYQLNLISRLNIEGSYPCICDANFQKNAYIWKLMVIFPDGGEHEFRPFGYTDRYSDGYFDIDPHGTQYGATCSSIGPDACNFGQWQATTSGMTYYSTDGTFMRLFVPFTSGSFPENWHNNWTLSFPDGKRLITAPGSQTMLDRNDNIIPMGLQDTLGRQIDMQPGNGPDEDRILVTGANQQQLEWIVKWKTIYVSRPYTATAPSGGRERGNSTTQVLTNEARVVDRITLPAQAGGLTYVFGYSASNTDVFPDYSPGWGELNEITLPTGARVNYTWAFDGPPSGRPPNWDWVLTNYPKRKDLTYLRQYDGTSTPTTESWTYGGTFRISSTFSVTAPDGGVTTTYSFAASTNSPFVGYAFKTEHPDGSVTERVWKQNRPQGLPVIPKAVNPYVEREFHSIRNALGALTKTKITKYNFDKNGNPTGVNDYDWVDYASLQRDAEGNFVIPAHAVLIKRTTSTYYNTTPDATDSTTPSGNVYYTSSAPRLLTAARALEISGGGAALARTEFFYDNPLTTGNLTERKTWDSAKGPYSNPLTTANSISVATQYNPLGSPIQITDARGVKTRFTYGPIGGFSDLYPTEVETALDTPRERTEERQYDFNTGLVTSVRDADNDVTTITTYDDLGRSILVRNAADLPDETQTSTQYFDAERRVVTRSDLDSAGDGKLVNIYHYDQLGRVRLKRTLEEFSAAALTDESIGIKVQTRYFVKNPCQPTNSPQCLADNAAVLGIYVVTSNPYRAATSTDASTESTMGWTRARSDKTGRTVETQTFTGAGLPPPWDTNAASTGTITTVYDGIFTTVTDQAGKVRRNQIDALGRLIRLDEPSDLNNTLGLPDSPTQHTSYQYDALGNLTAVNQGAQTRTFNYTSLSRLKDAINPESGTVSFVYDGNGNLTLKTDPRLLPNSSTHVSIIYEYDELNRLTSRTYNNGTSNVSYEYDDADTLRSKGRLTSVSSSASVYSCGEYDALGRVKSGTQTTDGQTYTISYAYNKAGALVSQTYPSGRVVKTDYDAAGRVSGVKNQATATYYAGAAGSDAINRFQYSPGGAVQGMRLGNGLWEHTDINSRLQITQIGLGTSVSDSSKLKLDYTFGVLVGGVLDPTRNNGNVQSQTITLPGVNAIVQNFEYDQLNRLRIAQEVGTSGWTEQFTYDRFGNRTGVSITDNAGFPLSTLAPEVDSSNNRLKEINSQNQSTGYDYDDAGNLTLEPEPGATFKKYLYNAENRLMQAKRVAGTSESVIATYSYDGDGRRVKRVVGSVTTIYVYNILGQTVAEYTDGATSVGGTSYVTADILGSTRVVTGSNGEAKARYDYLPFGEEIPTAYSNRGTVAGYGVDNINQKFTSKERDNETQLDNFGARYLGTAKGRFTSVDPLRASATPSDPQTWNRYTYVLNRPTIAIDPDGRSVIIVVVSPRSAGGSGSATTLVMDRRGAVVSVGRHGKDPIPSLAKGSGADRTQTNNDTPFGVYSIFRDARSDTDTNGRHTGTQGGTATSRPRGEAFGTGIIYMRAEAGEVVQNNRDTIYFHGGGSALGPNAWDPDQPLVATHGCIRLANQDVNSLIQVVNSLDTNGDPVTGIFVGDAATLYSLAEQRDRNGNYMYPQLRLALGIDQPPPQPEPTPEESQEEEAEQENEDE